MKKAIKKIFKISLLLFLSLLIIGLGFFIYYLTVTMGVHLDNDKLINMENSVVFYDSEEEKIADVFNTNTVVDIEELPEYVKSAFISTEDKRFYNHKGIDLRGMARAAVRNISSFSFKEGGSTISQQLIKNTHLTNEKTLKRKMIEIKLTGELEKIHTKDEILEMYLNTIYFGENAYGIEDASKLYFNKNVNELTIAESAGLAGIVKAPNSFSPKKNKEKFNERKELVLKNMFEQNYIDENEYQQAISETISISQTPENLSNKYLNAAYKELNDIIEQNKNGSKLKVYTFYNKNIQQILENNVNNDELNCNKSIVVIDNEKNGIAAVYSNDLSIKRSPGSTIKPFGVYAPCLQEKIITPLTKISDEKTDYNGYSPSNYNDLYYGYVSVKDSLAKSLNTCAVKLLNYLTIEKAEKYLNKMNVYLNDSEKNLSLALGAMEEGIDLKKITDAYSVFANDGEFTESKIIKEIRDENDKTIYKVKHNKTKVFSPETAYLMRDMLKETVKSGTAKKLSFLDFDVYAKTGTVGNEKGNLDAYSISLTKDYTMGVWYGKYDYSYMDNTITGGTYPTYLSKTIWQKIYLNHKPQIYKNNYDIISLRLDKYSYDKDNDLLLANEYTPERFVFYGEFDRKNQPKKISKAFSEPSIRIEEFSVNSDNILIKLCQTELCECFIYKRYKDKYEIVYDSLNDGSFTFKDYDLLPDTEYEYSVIPYIVIEGNIIIGKEELLPKFKMPKSSIPEDLGNWWDND